MTKYIVKGGLPIRGKVTLRGAKNAGFKAMIAALLASSPSTICNLGLISEIGFASQIITSLGGKVTPEKYSHCLSVDPRGVTSFEIPSKLSDKSRFSMMYAGPLLAKFGKVAFPQPGGDKFAKRPIERHIEGLQALGVKIQFRDNMFLASAPKGLIGATYRFAKNSHNGTEVILLAAVRARGTTIIENASAEPEVDDLIKYLNGMGAKIVRLAPRTIKVIGQKVLGGARHEVMPDRNEAVTYACMALGTAGEVTVNRADRTVLKAFLEKVEEAGGGVEIKKKGIRFYYKGQLRATDIVAVPYPGFMTDWQPLWATLMSQATGVSTIHEAVYENRFDYVPGLVEMGARIELFQPKVENPEEFYNFNLKDDSPEFRHAIRISGPTKLSGRQIEVNDVRTGATALLAGMIANGMTTILDPKDQIKRGYEKLEENLVSSGANIQILETPAV